MTNLLSKEDFDPNDWSNHKWQWKNSIRSLDAARKWINITPEEEAAIKNCNSIYKWQVTPYYMSLMDKNDPTCPVRLQSIPHDNEVLDFEGVDTDPVGDTKYSVTNRVIHKYPNRVVFLATDVCPVYCRHCTRKEHTTAKGEASTYFGDVARRNKTPYDDDFSYIADHPKIEDVLITGGDPLSLNDKKLEVLLGGLNEIPHLKAIRVGSRFPVLMPQRITSDLCQILDRNGVKWFSTHFNHVREITDEAIGAVEKLRRAGMTVQNQTVLLRGVNDSVEAMRDLNMKLVEIGVRPYYLYHADNVRGTAHFMTTINEGLDIIEGMEGHITGFGVPKYIVTTDIGKIGLSRNFTKVNSLGQLEVQNYKGESHTLPYGMDDVLKPVDAS